MASIRKILWPSHSERFAYCALTLQYITYMKHSRLVHSLNIRPRKHIYLGRIYVLAMDLPTILCITYCTAPSCMIAIVVKLSM